MHFVLEFAARIIIQVVFGVLFVPLTIVIWLPIAAMKALYDEEPYTQALRKRIEDAVATVSRLGAFFAGGI